MPQFFIIVGAVFAFISVVTRSLSSHAIQPFLLERGKLENFNIGSDYLLFHGIALIALAILCHLFPDAQYKWGGWFIMTGAGIFGLTVLAKSCFSIHPFGVLTPIGGFILMVGWCLVAGAAIKQM